LNEQKTTLVICADVNSQIGIGHMMRCITLADSWKKNGGRCLIFGKIEAPSLRDRLLANGYEFFEISSEPASIVLRLKNLKISNAWVILDGYHFGPELHDDLINLGLCVLCIDDGAKLSRYPAQVILAQDGDILSYHHKAPPSSLILSGPLYRLLRQGIVEKSKKKGVSSNNAVILVTFGGADTKNFTLTLVKVLDKILNKDDYVIIILGSVNKHRDSVVQALEKVAYEYELLQDVEDMSELYFRADLAISSAGGTAWEIAAAGLPAVLISVTDNQKPGADFLARVGAAIRLDEPSEIYSKSFASQFKNLLSDKQKRVAMSEVGRNLCDRKGSQRVVNILDALDQKRLKHHLFRVRKAVSSDMDQIYRIATDPDVRANSFSPTPIIFDNHAHWYTARLESLNTAMFVLELEGIVVAVVRYDRIEKCADIDLAVHSAFRGNGLGSYILKETVSDALYYLDVSILRAIVLEHNLASRHCFIKAGFTDNGYENIKNEQCALFTFEER
jgi:UDP-2,4-diacetamido-2,4,6-trideoxy-beta-L-altropyranose hydrolase